jgi:KDO2-lipid IV(A) lauroyltransferase
VLAFVVGDILGVRRDHVVASMTRAGLPRPATTARAMYRGLGRGLFELIAVGLRLPGALRRVALPTDALAALRRNGRGAVIATAHTGNWDLVACAVAGDTPLTVVTKHFSVRALDVLWQRVRGARGVHLVAAGKASRAIAAALRDGEFVAMLVDQAPERTRAVVEAPFLGAPALIDLAPALSALRARVPLAAVFPLRLADGSHTATIAAVFEPPARPSRRWAEDVMREVTFLLDAHVREHPEQWLWMHRRWKGAPAGGSSAPAGLAGAWS